MLSVSNSFSYVAMQIVSDENCWTPDLWGFFVCFFHFVSAGIRSEFILFTIADLSQQVQTAMENMLKMIKWVAMLC